tara:strand:- start:10069 stop:10170 length:102 start_codon:yes stop_codon:yes gene_type:complete
VLNAALKNNRWIRRTIINMEEVISEYQTLADIA